MENILLKYAALLFLAVVSSARAQTITFTVTGTAEVPATSGSFHYVYPGLGYTTGQSYTFTLTLTSSFPNNANSSFSSTGNLWQQNGWFTPSGGNPALFSSVTGSGLTGNLTTNGNDFLRMGPDYGELLRMQDASGGTPTVTDGLSANGTPLWYVSLTIPNSATSSLLFARSGSYTNPTAYFGDYIGSYNLSSGMIALASTGSTDMADMRIFDLTNLTISSSGGGAAVPEPSTYAAIFGAAVLGFATYKRRGQVGQPKS